MKREMDLVRAILLKSEESENTKGFVDLELDGFDNAQISYHVVIMEDAGLIKAMNLTTTQGVKWRPVSLTWAGHEFLDLAKNENIWNKAKKIVLSKTGSLTIEAMKISLSLLIKQALSQE